MKERRVVNYYPEKDCIGCAKYHPVNYLAIKPLGDCGGFCGYLSGHSDDRKPLALKKVYEGLTMLNGKAICLQSKD